MKEKIVVGKIANTHGLKGEMKVYPYSDKENFEGYTSLMIEGVEGKHKVSQVRYSKNMVILKLKGLNRIEEVEGLRNRELSIYKDDLEPLADDEFYVVDIIGCHVFDEAGKVLGVIKDYLTHTSQAVFVIEGADGGEFMVPHVDAFVAQIDIAAKRVVMKLIEGLM
ncbi:MAG: 16S rRNA processing protein RimM [Clostridia bacterium]|nr:16S rRNA processing protein RimM [Clostridia bacterium]